MPEFLDPIIVSIAVMDRQHLTQAREKYRPMVRAARWQFLRLWIRNRIAVFIAGAFFIFLTAGALSLWFGKSRDPSSWAVLGAGAICWGVAWLFYTNSPLNDLSGKWETQELKAREIWETHSYTLSVIHRRLVQRIDEG